LAPCQPFFLPWLQPGGVLALPQPSRSPELLKLRDDVLVPLER